MSEQKSFMDYVKSVGSWVADNILPAFEAAVRQGTKEVAQVLPAFPDSIQPVEQIGTMGNPTQMQVNTEIGAYDQWLESKQRAMSSPEPEQQIQAEL